MKMGTPSKESITNSVNFIEKLVEKMFSEEGLGKEYDKILEELPEESLTKIEGLVNEKISKNILKSDLFKYKWEFNKNIEKGYKILEKLRKIKKKMPSYQRYRKILAIILNTKRKEGIPSTFINHLKRYGYDVEKMAKINYLGKKFFLEPLNKGDINFLKTLPKEELHNFKKSINNRITKLIPSQNLLFYLINKFFLQRSRSQSDFKIKLSQAEIERIKDLIDNKISELEQKEKPELKILELLKDKISFGINPNENDFSFMGSLPKEILKKITDHIKDIKINTHDESRTLWLGSLLLRIDSTRQEANNNKL